MEATLECRVASLAFGVHGMEECMEITVLSGASSSYWRNPCSFAFPIIIIKLTTQVGFSGFGFRI